MTDWQFVDDPLAEDGCDLRTDSFGSTHPAFASAIQTIPREAWFEQAEEESNEALVDQIMNQRGEGSCASFAVTQCYQIVFNRTFQPQNAIQFSPQPLFKQCASSPRGGSTISCNFRYLRDYGVLPQDTPENRSWMSEAGINPDHVLNPVGYHQRMPQDWQQTANYFRGFETYDLADFDQMASALLNGFPVAYGRAGHAICGVRLVKAKGQWAVRYANSWGPWGDSGYGVDTESYISRAIRNYGAIALRSIRTSDVLIEALA